MPHDLPRRFMRVVVRRQEALMPPGLRAPTGADVPALGALMHRAYRGTVDSEDETLDQAIQAVRDTFDGTFGRFMPECSAVIERDGAMLSATLVTRWEDRPLVAFTMTDPAAQRQGLARAGILHAMNRLLEAGEYRLRLVVTVANEPARRLYESLGFEFE